MSTIPYLNGCGLEGSDCCLPAPTPTPKPEPIPPKPDEDEDEDECCCCENLNVRICEANIKADDAKNIANTALVAASTAAADAKKALDNSKDIPDVTELNNKVNTLTTLVGTNTSNISALSNTQSSQGIKINSLQSDVNLLQSTTNSMMGLWDNLNNVVAAIGVGYENRYGETDKLYLMSLVLHPTNSTGESVYDLIPEATTEKNGLLSSHDKENLNTWDTILNDNAINYSENDKGLTLLGGYQSTRHQVNLGQDLEILADNGHLTMVGDGISISLVGSSNNIFIDKDSVQVGYYTYLLKNNESDLITLPNVYDYLKGSNLLDSSKVNTISSPYHKITDTNLYVYDVPEENHNLTSILLIKLSDDVSEVWAGDEVLQPPYILDRSVILYKYITKVTYYNKQYNYFHILYNNKEISIDGGNGGGITLGMLADEIGNVNGYVLETDDSYPEAESDLRNIVPMEVTYSLNNLKNILLNLIKSNIYRSNTTLNVDNDHDGIYVLCPFNNDLIIEAGGLGGILWDGTTFYLTEGDGESNTWTLEFGDNYDTEVSSVDSNGEILILVPKEFDLYSKMLSYKETVSLNDINNEEYNMNISGTFDVLDLNFNIGRVTNMSNNLQDGNVTKTKYCQILETFYDYDSTNNVFVKPDASNWRLAKRYVRYKEDSESSWDYWNLLLN